MLIKYNYDLSDLIDAAAYWDMFRMLSDKGHKIIKCWEREAPGAVSQVWLAGRDYVTESGALVWSWVEFHRERRCKHIRCGYYLEGVAPLPAPASPAPSARPVLRRKGATRGAEGRAVQAARWFFAHKTASRKDAAHKFGITVAAVGVAINRIYHPATIPQGRPGIEAAAPRRSTRGKDAAQWLAAHPDFTRYDAARLFGISYTRVCQTVLALGLRIPPAHKHGADRTDVEIEAMRSTLPK